MLEKIVISGLQCSVYALELGLCLFLIWRGHWRRATAASLYVFLLFLVDAVSRPYVLYRYGLASGEYANFFYLSDVCLVLAAFALVCTLFRRACVHQDYLWRHLRVFLVSVFLGVLVFTSIPVFQNYAHMFSAFIYEFERNLYFTCLVLDTLLFILMQQIESADEELELLVCGLGIQFAAPAANLALVYILPGQAYAKELLAYVPALCTLGMLLIWLYAFARRPALAGVPAAKGRLAETAKVAVRKA
jgi:hypothetical protein